MNNKSKLPLVSVVIYGLFYLNVYSAEMPSEHKGPVAFPEKPIQNSIEMVLGYDFKVPGDTHRIIFLVVLPKTIPGRQEILSIECSEKPVEFINVDQNKYARFIFDRPNEKFKLEIIIKAKLFRYDLFNARKNKIKNPLNNPDLEMFLKEEKFIDVNNPHILKTAKSIKGDKKIEQLRNIYYYVLDNLEYKIQGEKDRGALYALNNKKGDCSEYADLFVALCRAKNIPARVVTGYTERHDGTSPKHIWTEAYLKKYGWIPFDPSWGDVPNKSLRKIRFERMSPVYLHLTNIRNDKMLYNRHFYALIFWGQKVEVTDSVKFRQRKESPSETR